MFYLMNSTDRSIVAEIKDYENIDDELKADQKRLKAYLTSWPILIQRIRCGSLPTASLLA
jgi:hypothetical protein